MKMIIYKRYIENTGNIEKYKTYIEEYRRYICIKHVDFIDIQEKNDRFSFIHRG